MNKLKGDDDNEDDLEDEKLEELDNLMKTIHKVGGESGVN